MIDETSLGHFGCCPAEAMLRSATAPARFLLDELGQGHGRRLELFAPL